MQEEPFEINGQNLQVDSARSPENNRKESNSSRNLEDNRDFMAKNEQEQEQINNSGALVLQITEDSQEVHQQQQQLQRSRKIQNNFEQKQGILKQNLARNRTSTNSPRALLTQKNRDLMLQQGQISLAGQANLQGQLQTQGIQKRNLVKLSEEPELQLMDDFGAQFLNTSKRSQISMPRFVGPGPTSNTRIAVLNQMDDSVDRYSFEPPVALHSLPQIDTRQGSVRFDEYKIQKQKMASRRTKSLIKQRIMIESQYSKGIDDNIQDTLPQETLQKQAIKYAQQRKFLKVNSMRDEKDYDQKDDLRNDLSRNFNSQIQTSKAKDSAPKIGNRLLKDGQAELEILKTGNEFILISNRSRSIEPSRINQFESKVLLAQRKKSNQEKQPVWRATFASHEHSLLASNNPKFSQNSPPHIAGNQSIKSEPILEEQPHQQQFQIDRILPFTTAQVVKNQKNKRARVFLKNFSGSGKVINSRPLNKSLKNKIKMLRLLEIMSPDMTQKDTLERVLFLIQGHQSKQTNFEFEIEDLIDFVMTDQEVQKDGKIRQKMFHKFYRDQQPKSNQLNPTRLSQAIDNFEASVGVPKQNFTRITSCGMCSSEKLIQQNIEQVKSVVSQNQLKFQKTSLGPLHSLYKNQQLFNLNSENIDKVGALMNVNEDSEDLERNQHNQGQPMQIKTSYVNNFDQNIFEKDRQYQPQNFMLVEENPRDENQGQMIGHSDLQKKVPQQQVKSPYLSAKAFRMNETVRSRISRENINQGVGKHDPNTNENSFEHNSIISRNTPFEPVFGAINQQTALPEANHRKLLGSIRNGVNSSMLDYSGAHLNDTNQEHAFANQNEQSFEYPPNQPAQLIQHSEYQTKLIWQVDVESDMKINENQPGSELRLRQQKAQPNLFQSAAALSSQKRTQYGVAKKHHHHRRHFGNNMLEPADKLISGITSPNNRLVIGDQRSHNNSLRVEAKEISIVAGVEGQSQGQGVRRNTRQPQIYDTQYDLYNLSRGGEERGDDEQASPQNYSTLGGKVATKLDQHHQRQQQAATNQLNSSLQSYVNSDAYFARQLAQGIGGVKVSKSLKPHINGNLRQQEGVYQPDFSKSLRSKWGHGSGLESSNLRRKANLMQQDRMATEMSMQNDEELCQICGLPESDHAVDFNQQLIQETKSSAGSGLMKESGQPHGIVTRESQDLKTTNLILNSEDNQSESLKDSQRIYDDHDMSSPEKQVQSPTMNNQFKKIQKEILERKTKLSQKQQSRKNSQDLSQIKRNESYEEGTRLEHSTTKGEIDRQTQINKLDPSEIQSQNLAKQGVDIQKCLQMMFGSEENQEILRSQFESLCQICCCETGQNCSEFTKFEGDGNHKICQNCFMKCLNLCAFCQKEQNQQQENSIISGNINETSCLICPQCGQENCGEQKEKVYTRQCNFCHYKQCLLCSLEFHPNLSCDEFIELRYKQLKRGNQKSAVFGDSQSEYQMCVQCDKIIQLPQNCAHYGCWSCEHIFCVYCRQIWTPCHMNPFSLQPCKIFENQNIPFAQTEPPSLDLIAKLATNPFLIVLFLLIWIVLGLPISLILAPILGFGHFKKLTTNRAMLSLLVMALLVLSPILATVLYIAIIGQIIAYGWKQIRNYQSKQSDVQIKKLTGRSQSEKIHTEASLVFQNSNL